ncbi:N-acetylglucosamine-6-phosphate deacetylase [Emticicia sp. BO119]|uniref:N-acetylglucosamine-6-phosphate deacetylase n=1 Tax=Emticicia sp. BO119 TaxID=2757768 RepID=UPI0015F0A3CF|nr:N-acetylglucosamine-6-phosphate deacetylase [Emticicia sp. BO119]MBA4850188.1 N-acetylglucosamine-6-phosphate deacetylase [Emticicia sp. BO119]
MRLTKIVNGRVITPHEILQNTTIVVKNGKIDRVFTQPIEIEEAQIIDACGNFVSPGFIDIHLHGGGSYDFMDNTIEAFQQIAITHAQHGTTAMVPTTLTSTKGNLIKTLETYELTTKTQYKGAGFLGVHIEGPYFAMSQRGAQDPKYIRLPDADEYNEILNRFPFITRWSAAPELPGAVEFGKVLHKNNIIASIAHTEALYADVIKAQEVGYSLMTHLYSGMVGVIRKEGFRYAGTVESAFLLDDMDVEVIADLKHLPVELLQLVYKIKGSDRMALITDAMRAAGTNATTSKLGSLEDGLDVIVEDEVAKLPDRQSFAGSVATADKLLKNLVKNVGISILEAVKMLTATPARIMKVQNSKGKIEKSFDADLVIFDNDFNIRSTIVNGKVVFQKR